jgi:hypothetical protein
MTPVQSVGRFNLRTMSASTKERLEMRVEERYGWTSRTSRQEVDGYPGRYYAVLRNTRVIPAIFESKLRVLHAEWNHKNMSSV